MWVTYGSFDFGIKVPNSFILSLMLNRLLLSTVEQKQRKSIPHQDRIKKTLTDKKYWWKCAETNTHSDCGCLFSASPWPALLPQLLGKHTLMKQWQKAERFQCRLFTAADLNVCFFLFWSKWTRRTHRKPFRPLIVVIFATGSRLIQHMHDGRRLWNYEIDYFALLKMIYERVFFFFTLELHLSHLNCTKAWRVVSFLNYYYY